MWKALLGSAGVVTAAEKAMLPFPRLGVEASGREQLLSDEDFQSAFGSTKEPRKSRFGAVIFQHGPEPGGVPEASSLEENAEEEGVGPLLSLSF